MGAPVPTQVRIWIARGQARELWAWPRQGRALHLRKNECGHPRDPSSIAHAISIWASLLSWAMSVGLGIPHTFSGPVCSSPDTARAETAQRVLWCASCHMLSLYFKRWAHVASCSYPPMSYLSWYLSLWWSEIRSGKLPHENRHVFHEGW